MLTRNTLHQFQPLRQVFSPHHHCKLLRDLGYRERNPRSQNELPSLPYPQLYFQRMVISCVWVDRVILRITNYLPIVSYLASMSKLATLPRLFLSNPTRWRSSARG